MDDGVIVLDKLRMGSLVIEGILHKKISLGCQDACHLVDLPKSKVAIVCDGCSTTELGFSHNQVGAVLGAYSYASFLAAELNKLEFVDDLQFEEILMTTAERILLLFNNFCVNLDLEPFTEGWNHFVLDKLLFTILGFAVKNDRYWIFGLGDGCYGCNEQITSIESSSTPYLGQSLMEKDGTLKPKIEVFQKGNIHNVYCLWTASDGIKDLLSSRTGKLAFYNFLQDELACAHNNKNEDTTIQAFRRKIYKNNMSRFSDDIALALIKIDLNSNAFKLLEGDNNE